MDVIVLLTKQIWGDYFMPRGRTLFLIVTVFLLVALSMVFVAQAQDTGKTCPEVVSDSLTALGMNCANLGRNSSCLGHEEVRHTSFVGSVPAGFYTQPGDRVDLPNVETVQTGPFNLAQEVWGLNVMNVNANVPLSASQRGVVFVQFGGVEVENGVEPDSAVQLVNGINVTTLAATDLLTWSQPAETGHASEVIASIPSGASVSLDALSPASDFGRVVYQNQVGWVSLASVDTSGVDLSGLPVIGADDYTPMQSFYFRTGVGGIPCTEAPSLLFVQGPDNVSVDIQVFKQPVRIESTVVFRSLPPGDQLGNTLELIVLSGLAKLYPDTPNEIIVPPGYKSTLLLCSEFDSLGIEGDSDEKPACGTWSQPIKLTEAELEELKPVEDIPDNITDYPVDVPIIVNGSCFGECESTLYFPNQAALDAAIAACQAGELDDETCQYLGVS